MKEHCDALSLKFSACARARVLCMHLNTISHMLAVSIECWVFSLARGRARAVYTAVQYVVHTHSHTRHTRHDTDGAAVYVYCYFAEG